MRPYPLDDLLVNSTNTVKDAMKKIDAAASRVVFVVDNKKIFVGSLSDGDIRRWILAGRSLDSSAQDACNRSAYCIVKDSDPDEVSAETRRRQIHIVPVLDMDRRVIDVFVADWATDLISRSQGGSLDIPAVIMAGGKGSRLAPFTSVLPKPLIPIGEKTILEIIIERFRRFGVDEFYFTINYRGEMIKAYFEGLQKDYQVKYIREDQFLGTAGSLRLLEGSISGDFIVTNCDILVDADYRDALKFHRDTHAALTVISSVQHHKVPYGVIDYTNGGEVIGIREKPEFTMTINTGVYIMSSAFLPSVPRSTVFNMTDLIEKLLRAKERVSMYPVGERDYVDIGQWEEYRKVVDRL